MEILKERYEKLQESLPGYVTLVVVSKTHPVEKMRVVYEAGARIFGENRVQEILAKKPLLPEDIQWHLIGQLQRNKVRAILPHVALIHSMDRESLFEEIQKEAVKMQLQPKVLLQVHVAKENTKAGFDSDELFSFVEKYRNNWLPVIPCGLMAMATFTDDEAQIESEFRQVQALFERLKTEFFKHNDAFSIVSMGMSSDWPIALRCGSNMIRVGSRIFGER